VVSAGWWQYDERTSAELESAYKRGERSCELLIAGFLYVADFDGMVQLRRGDPSRRRRIKRDLATIPVKGVAGLRTRVAHPLQAVDDRCPSSRLQAGHGSTPPTPVNTPGATTPPPPRASPHSSSLRRVVEEMGRLQLNDQDSSPCEPAAAGEEEEEEGVVGVSRALESVLWSPVSPDIASTSPWVLTLSSDEDQL
jgi:E3 ubiquitin-protein ligase RNF146